MLLGIFWEPCVAFLMKFHKNLKQMLWWQGVHFCRASSIHMQLAIFVAVRLSSNDVCRYGEYYTFVSTFNRLIVEKEGTRALFKGLGPNLVGVAPSRAIYFCSYSQSKKTYNQIFPCESPIVHICSAATAGNPLNICILFISGTTTTAN